MKEVYCVNCEYFEEIDAIMEQEFYFQCNAPQNIRECSTWRNKLQELKFTPQKKNRNNNCDWFIKKEKNDSEFAFNKNKFLVINTKRFDELKDKGSVHTVNKLKSALHEFQHEYRFYVGGNKLDNEYLVCNVDEPYADKIIEIIAEGEKLK